MKSNLSKPEISILSALSAKNDWALMRDVLVWSSESMEIGELYPTLVRLEEKGLVRSRRSKAEIRPMFTLTLSGYETITKIENDSDCEDDDGWCGSCWSWPNFGEWSMVGAYLGSILIANLVIFVVRYFGRDDLDWLGPVSILAYFYLYHKTHT